MPPFLSVLNKGPVIVKENLSNSGPVVTTIVNQCIDCNRRVYTKDALSVWTNLGKHFVVRLGYASLV